MKTVQVHLITGKTLIYDIQNTANTHSGKSPSFKVMALPFWYSEALNWF